VTLPARSLRGDTRSAPRRLRAVVFRLLRRSGVPWLVRHTVQRRRATILVYHDPTPAVLERHLALLTRLYRVVSLREYIEQRAAGTLVVTLDDGYAANAALRDVFARFSVVPTIFVCTGIIGTNRGFWFRHVGDAGFDPSEERTVREALSDDEISDLATVADIQAHTVTHPILPRCSAEEAKSEIAGSKRDLEQRFGLDVYAFAYPNGEYTQRDVRLVQDAGYRCALAVGGRTDDGSADLYALPRITVDDHDGVDELVVKASGVWPWIERVSGRRG
jgi:peptidoglycan/xylan/chitin deacetylase (PgdA/CDA1 family)